MMRKEKREYEVYEFSELSDGAKDKAIEQFSNINVEYDWWEYIFEDSIRKLADMGYLDTDIHFSGFSSQGDGANFTANVNLDTWIKSHDKAFIKRFKSLVGADISMAITTSGHYEHEMTMNIDYYNNMESPADGRLLDEIADMIQEDARSEAKIIYRLLEREYYCLTDREAIIETIEANGYEFHKNGKFFTL